MVTRSDQGHPVHLSLAHAVAYRAEHLGTYGDASIGCRQGISARILPVKPRGATSEPRQPDTCASNESVPHGGICSA